VSVGFGEGFFFAEVLGMLGVFIWAAIGLKYHPASRLRWRASNGMHGKFVLRVVGFCGRVRFEDKPAMSSECFPITVLPHVSQIYRDYLALAESAGDAPVRRSY